MAGFEQLTTFNHRGFSVSLAFKQVKVYLQSGLVLLVIVTVGIVLWYNRGYRTPVWFFGLTDPNKSVNVLWLILWTAVATLGSWWTFSLGWGVLKDMREIKRLRKVSNAAKELDKREVELEKRERRVDLKLHRAVSDEEQPKDE